MLSIKDSSAVFSSRRSFPQHQSLLTLIKDRIDDPSKACFKWLDLACGRGQVLANIDRVLSSTSLSKIQYFAFDIVQEYCREVQQIANSIFGVCQVDVCAIDKFELYLSDETTFDAITMTNTVHEISPSQIASTFVSVLNRVTSDGFIYVYDVESLDQLELGAIPWHGTEIQEVLHTMLRTAGETTYFPSVATYAHKTCNGWNIQLNRSYLGVPLSELTTRRKEILEAVEKQIRDLLEKKLFDTHLQLEALSKYGAANEEEKIEIVRLTYDFWAISRALGGPSSMNMLIPNI